MNSTELLNEIKNQLELLNHKGYDKNSFKSGYLLGYAKALKLHKLLLTAKKRINTPKLRGLRQISKKQNKH